MGSTQLGSTAGTISGAQIAPGTITDSDVASNAAIAKSKLASLAIVDADVAGGASIAKSKLTALAIVDADVAGGAAIAKAKLAPLAIVDADVAGGAAIAKSKLAALAIVDADVAAGAAIASTKVAAVAQTLEAGYTFGTVINVPAGSRALICDLTVDMSPALAVAAAAQALVGSTEYSSVGVPANGGVTRRVVRLVIPAGSTGKFTNSGGTGVTYTVIGLSTTAI